MCHWWQKRKLKSSKAVNFKLRDTSPRGTLSRILSAAVKPVPIKKFRELFSLLSASKDFFPEPIFFRGNNESPVNRKIRYRKRFSAKKTRNVSSDLRHFFYGWRLSKLGHVGMGKTFGARKLKTYWLQSGN